MFILLLIFVGFFYSFSIFFCLKHLLIDTYIKNQLKNHYSILENNYFELQEAFHELNLLLTKPFILANNLSTPFFDLNYIFVVVGGILVFFLIKTPYIQGLFDNFFQELLYSAHYFTKTMGFNFLDKVIQGKDTSNNFLKILDKNNILEVFYGEPLMPVDIAHLLAVQKIYNALDLRSVRQDIVLLQENLSVFESKNAELISVVISRDEQIQFLEKKINALEYSIGQKTQLITELMLQMPPSIMVDDLSLFFI
jgi:hypothetical protein